MYRPISSRTLRHVMLIGFFDSLTPILITRFILNLRQVDQLVSISGKDMSFNQLSMPSFLVPESRITGNIGEDLQDSDPWEQEVGSASSEARGSGSQISENMEAADSGVQINSWRD